MPSGHELRGDCEGPVATSLGRSADILRRLLNNVNRNFERQHNLTITMLTACPLLRWLAWNRAEAGCPSGIGRLGGIFFRHLPENMEGAGGL